MSSDFKLDAVKGHDSEDPEVGSINGGVHLILPERRAVTLTDRLFRRSQGGHGEIVSTPNGGDEKHEHRRIIDVLSVMYCNALPNDFLLNKDETGTKNLISTTIVVLLGFSGVVIVEKLNWKLVGVWIPVNVIIIGMLVSGMYTAWRIMFVLETSESECVGCHVYDDYLCYQQWHYRYLPFDTVGYPWQLSNCVLIASYSLTLRPVMDEAKTCTRSGSLNEVSMVLLNNLLSLPFAAFWIILFDEWEYIMNVDVIKLPMFWVVATASGLLGLAISFTSMWFLHPTGPTTYSLVGSLNKIPISLAGLVLFRMPLNLYYLVYSPEYSLPGPKCPDLDLSIRMK